MVPTSRIFALPLHLANQIAAGEVIERPASVVKELVENSIDASANQIDIDIEGAGSQLIRVTDNGAGIHPDDLSLALSRHATSKLISSDQLSHINSLGFRGEALPSIASIAQLTLTSKQQDSASAWQLSPNQTEAKPASHPLGTTLEIRDLFFNLPARRRFLRSKQTEKNHILTTLYRLALSRFDVAINCQINNTNRLKLPVASDENRRRQRIAKICGQTFINNSFYLEQSYDDIDLKGWLGKVDAHRIQTDVQYFFINGRVIRDRIISHAVRQAYADRIPTGRHPAYVLYLTLPLDKVDVNVHPTKHEVRFHEARLIHGLITSGIQEALSHNDDTTFSGKQDDSAIPLKLDLSGAENDYQVTSFKQVSQQPKSANQPHIPKTVSLLHQRYVIIEYHEIPYLLDLQLATQIHKQYLFKQAVNDNNLSSRPILVPIKLTIKPDEVQLLKRHQHVLSKLGITFSLLDDAVILQTIASLLAQIELQALVQMICSALTQGKTSLEQLTIALKSLIPLNAINNDHQAQQLIQQLNENLFDHRWTCRLDQQRLISLFSK